MIDALTTRAEQRAVEAESFPAFSGLKLLHVKRELESLLGLIGMGGIFDTYTRHDISHIDEMLKILDWLIPRESQTAMSPADWLMVVLAIYFHDLGMLVTRSEYENRHKSGFKDFRDETLFGGLDGDSYRDKVEKLPPDDAERFLYQEFVRHKHAERIKAWVSGKAPEHLGIAHATMQEVERLLSSLKYQFRRDLSFICESHHLDDLNDFQKYRISQPYGNTPEQTVNLHWAAILLRTADLLHITEDRTPSVEFRTINPTDPISQQEWAKQMAVTSVRPQPGRDKEGNIDEHVPSDTIEVHAFFTKEDGFFGLTSYLKYAREQIRKSHDWAALAYKTHGSRLVFPWRNIDDSNVETEGFLREAFEFTIDQAKILDLLTGHTLYNDSQVVIRELVQNSLDAIRLQKHQDPDSPSGHVQITWDSRERVLCVMDNGTGMTQSIISNHLLRVGSSRYQDPEFQKQYPNFTSISRFGIGVLSAFMIADSVEIVTCHPDEDQVRQLSLRSVHGKYLIRLLPKDSSEIVKQLAPHGTLVKLSVRPKARFEDILRTARRWIVIPGCQATIAVDSEPPVTVGYPTPREALADLLIKKNVITPVGGSEFEYPISQSRSRVRIEQRDRAGVSLAYAIKWNDYFQEWDLLTSEYLRISDDRDSVLLGTCIEGIRVEFGTPGFEGDSIVAIANITGQGAPKTNVARSGIENTPERDTMLQTIYSIYCDHIRDEIESLHKERSFSLTWAVHESRFLLEPIVRTIRNNENKVDPSNKTILINNIINIPIYVIDRRSNRQAVSPNELLGEKIFWTIDSAFFHWAEFLMREFPGATSLGKLVGALQTSSILLPDDTLLCGPKGTELVDEILFASKEVDLIQIDRNQRRVDLRWVDQSEPHRWLVFSDNIRIFNRGVECIGLKNEHILITSGYIFLLPNNPIGSFLTPLLSMRNLPKDNISAIGKMLELIILKGADINHIKELIRGELGPSYYECNIASLMDVIYDSYKDEYVFNINRWSR